MWGDMNTAGCKQSKFLECTDDSFLTRVIKEQTWVYARLGLLANKEDLLGDVTGGSSLGSSEHGMKEIRIRKGRTVT